jgi:hypothetical protein
MRQRCGSAGATVHVKEELNVAELRTAHPDESNGAVAQPDRGCDGGQRFGKQMMGPAVAPSRPHLSRSEACGKRAAWNLLATDQHGRGEFRVLVSILERPGFCACLCLGRSAIRSMSRESLGGMSESRCVMTQAWPDLPPVTTFVSPGYRSRHGDASMGDIS